MGLDKNGFYDFSAIRERMGFIIRFLKGGISLSDLKNMDWFEVLKWDYICELQATEEEVVSELSYDDKGNKKKLPSSETIREIVNERIEKRKEKINGIKV